MDCVMHGFLWIEFIKPIENTTCNVPNTTWVSSMLAIQIISYENYTDEVRATAHKVR